MTLCKKENCASLTFFFVFFLYACKYEVITVDNIYHYRQPIYDQVSLVAKPDTLHFNLGENTYNQIKAFNLFRDKGINYISFYDRRSESINIYYLMDQRIYKSISLKKLFKNRQLYKTSVFVKNWDSIWVINKNTISLFDSNGHRKQKIEFPTKPVNNAADFDNHNQPVFKGNMLFAISANNVDDKSINALRDWKVMYQFDLEKGKTDLSYPLPQNYQKHLYGYYFLRYNFCYNNHGKFVFSFPTDTLLYETDLAGYNHSYYARSQEHHDIILPVSKEELEEDQGRKAYVTRNSYSSVFYDPFQKYYLRQVKHKLNPQEYTANKHQRRTVLILNEQFQIVGESTWPEGIDFDSLLFTPDGQLFARTNPRDENALHFVRLTYEISKDTAEELTRK